MPLCGLKESDTHQTSQRMKKEEDESVKNPFSSLSGFYLDSLDKLASLVNEDTEVKLCDPLLVMGSVRGSILLFSREGWRGSSDVSRKHAWQISSLPQVTGVLANANRAPIRMSFCLPNKELVKIQKADCSLLRKTHRRPSLGSLDPDHRVIISRGWWGEQRKEYFLLATKNLWPGGGASELKANYSILNCKCAIFQVKMALCWQTVTEHFSTKIYMMTVKKRWKFRVPTQRDNQWGFLSLSLSHMCTHTHTRFYLMKNPSFSLKIHHGRKPREISFLSCLPPTQRSGI